MQLVDEIFMRKAMVYTKSFPQTLTAGGSAANTINGLANLGVPTAFIGKIGNDETGCAFESDMVRNGIVPLLLKGYAETGRALALVSPDSERTFATYLGSAVEMVAENLNAEMFEGYEFFHIEGYLVQNHDLIRRAVELAHKMGVKISLDLASYNVVEENLPFLKEIIQKYVDIVFANEEEARTFTGKSPEEALDILGSMTSIAVVKLGKYGSLIKRGDEYMKVGVINIDRVDTTGAGDMYSAGFLYGLIKNLPLDKCGEIGAILSSFVIGVLGAKMNEERWAKIREMVAEVEKN